MKDWVAGLLILILALISVGIIWVVLSYDSGTSYEMDNGAICSGMGERYGNYHFYYCSDGRDYINPASWKEIKK